MTSVEAMGKLYESLGGNPEDFTAITNPEAIMMLSEIEGVKKVIADAEAQSSVLFETSVSDMQGADLTVGDGYISGTLKKLTTGSLVDVFGAGHFMALRFINLNPGAVVKIGIVPTEGTGFVALDEDMNATIKVTDKDSQTFQILTEKDGITKKQVYDLSMLTLEE